MKKLKNLIYDSIELATSHKGLARTISGVTMRLPVRYARWFAEDYESNNVKFIQDKVKPGMSVLDIGAHMGFFSVILGRAVGPEGRVISFEPTPSTFSLLERVVHINDLDDVVKVNQKAVSDTCGQVTFYISEFEGDNANSLGEWKRPGESGVQVEKVSVDSLIDSENLTRLDFIKVDAEGAELYVLKGMVGALKQFQPIVQLALHPNSIVRNFGGSLQEIWDFIGTLDYTIYYEGELISNQDFVAKKSNFDVHLQKRETAQSS